MVFCLMICRPAAHQNPGVVKAGGLWYVLGMLMGSMGVACMFRTYLAAEVYELFVKEVSRAFGVEIHRFKTAYDCVSCLIGRCSAWPWRGFFTGEAARGSTP